MRKKHNIRQTFLIKKLFAERAHLKYLIEQYEEIMDNAIGFRSNIIEAINNEKDEDFCLQIMGRLGAATDKFTNSIENEE